MVLEKYSKADLKKIVEIYNIGLSEKELKKKKGDIIKAMKGQKKSFNETDIDTKLEKKESMTSEKADKKKEGKASKKYREDLGKKVKDMSVAERKKYQALLMKESRQKKKEKKT